jgi:hypothetical protein
VVSIGKENVEQVGVTEYQRHVHGTTQIEKDAVWQPHIAGLLEVVERR